MQSARRGPDRGARHARDRPHHRAVPGHRRDVRRAPRRARLPLARRPPPHLGTRRGHAPRPRPAARRHGARAAHGREDAGRELEARRTDDGMSLVVEVERRERVRVDRGVERQRDEDLLLAPGDDVEQQLDDLPLWQVLQDLTSQLALEAGRIGDERVGEGERGSAAIVQPARARSARPRRARPRRVPACLAPARRRDSQVLQSW